MFFFNINQGPVRYDIEEAYGDHDPYVSTLFDEIWYVDDGGDCCSRVSSQSISKSEGVYEEGEEVDSKACKRLKLSIGPLGNAS